MSIDRALRQRAAEMGMDPRWNLEQVSSIFGTTVKEELVDLGDTLKVLDSKHADNPNTMLSDRVRNFHASHESSPPRSSSLCCSCQYSDPSDLVLIFDNTFGTNIYGKSLGFIVSPD